MAISIDELANEITRELTAYNKDIVDGIKEVTKAQMKQLVKDTKNTAPVGKRNKHYKSHIKSKTLENTYRSFSSLWYVDGDDYRLSHLLNNGHATRNGGRVEGTGFITEAERKAIEEYERKIEEIIRNG